MNLDSSNIDITVAAIVAIWAVAGILYLPYWRRHRSITLPNASVLLAFYTDVSMIAPIQEGNFGDLHYSAMIATNYFAQGSDVPTSFIYRVELPFLTSIHLVGIPKQTGATQLDPTRGKSLMEKVELEGDYNDYFDLYCEKGMQEMARYVLDPKAMLFTLDFCQSQNWEIVGNELLFIQAENMRDQKDETGLEEDIVKFVAEIRPAIERPLNDEQKAALAPYGEDRRTDLKCPICGKTLTNQTNYFLCPDGHGVLLTGGNLEQVKQGKLKLPENLAPPAQHATPFICPSCGHDMEKVAYDGGATTIDSCTNCPFRWLDPGEYKPLPQI